MAAATLTRDPDPATTTSWRQAVWLPVAVAVVVKLALNGLVSGRYGWHTDELYYADTGRHLDWGFVDFPPVTPVLAAVARVLLGDSLIALRLVASLAGAATLVVIGLLVRELGGGRRALTIAMLATLPAVLGSNAMFQTVSFDQLCWALVLLAFLRLRPGSSHGWATLGAAMALAWMTKYTVAVLFAGLVIGLIATRPGRARWSTGGAVLAGGIVTLVALPNLWWQSRHGWPSVDFFTGRHGEVSDENPPVRFAAELLILATPLALPVWVAGVRRLLRPEWRHAGVAAVLVAPLWLVLGGKAYYALPVFFLLHAAGAVTIAERRHGPRYPIILGLSVVAALPLTLPILPTSTMVSLGLADLRDDYANQVGWEELAGDVDRAWGGLTGAERERALVVTDDYASAGAVRRFGRADAGEAPPVVSAHLTNRYWPVPAEALDARIVVAVGLPTGWLARHCADRTRIATVRNRWNVENEAAGTAVVRCDLRPGITASDLRDDL